MLSVSSRLARSSVQLNGRITGLPMDSGPMAFFYNEDVFEQAGGRAKIRTWDDYEAAKLKEIGVYITAVPVMPVSMMR